MPSSRPPSASSTPPAASASSSAFAGLGLSEALVAAVTALGYEEPTAVQRETIPVMLSGRDLLAQAATGTGKTAAFALPIIHRLTVPLEAPAAPIAPAAPAAPDAPAATPATPATAMPAAAKFDLSASADADAAAAASPASKPTPKSKTQPRRPRALVLVPTRELAMQVSEAVHKYGRGSRLDVVPIYGGASMGQQIRALDRGADIVVATPGRALDHMRRKTLHLDALSVLVLDEADEMLDMGFADELDEILKATPPSRQTTLFSATLPARIQAIAARHLRDPRRVTIANEKAVAGELPRVRQVAYVVRRDQKSEALGRVLDIEEPTSALVFCRTRVEVDALVETLSAHGYRAEALHGGMQQRQRDAVMTRFRAAKADLLIATDVAARGLDIQHLSHVVNYDLPASSEAYVHRIGRTGRAGREGTAITFVEPRERRHLHSIERVTRQQIEIAAIPTVVDLRARRLERLRAALVERLAAGELDELRGLVDSLAGEFEPGQVAAAALALLQAAEGGDDEPEGADAFANQPDPYRREAEGGFDGGRPRGRQQLRGAGIDDPVRLYVGAGYQAGIRPGDLVGMITGETGISSRQLGAIEIADRFSLVVVPDARADEIILAMKKGSLRGKKVSVRRFREE